MRLRFNNTGLVLTLEYVLTVEPFSINREGKAMFNVAVLLIDKTCRKAVPHSLFKEKGLGDEFCIPAY